MSVVNVPKNSRQSLTAKVANSGPLSPHNWAGTLRSASNSSRVRASSLAVNDRSIAHLASGPARLMAPPGTPKQRRGFLCLR